jgi:M6 family metalloprotease-like protein
VTVKKIIVLLPILAALIFSAVGVDGRELLLPSPRKVTITDNSGLPERRGFKSDISKKNLLGLDRPTPFSLPTSKHGKPIGETLDTDTLKILVLRVEFQPENPDYDSTTGTGVFDMRSRDQFLADEGHDIDSAPHNAAYFNSHMEALRRYYYFVSDQTLNLTWDIYPATIDSAYRLPVEMAYYGSRGPWADGSIGDRLGHFVIDAITYIDSVSPDIDFSAYQSVFLFHAGSDQQNNIAFIKNTPDDFFTGFIRLAEPIIVDGGNASVQEGLIMPETASQDNRVNALNSVIAHEFGHQLGLVDLYNTSNFMTQVGDFSLMDDNGASIGLQFEDNGPIVGGAMPIYPDAWSRAYLGFNVPRTLTRGENETVSAAVMSYPDSEIIKLPITDFEYYLVENREQVKDSTALIADQETGVILGPGYRNNEELLIANGEYDLLIPGNGMLIWHVDEYVAYLNYLASYGYDGNNFYNNTLQWDKDRRFVSLVEADGIIDFGGNYYAGYGSDAEFFKVGNATSFTPYTRPPTRSNLGGDTHIYVTGISHADTFMTCDIDNDWLLAGWPQMSRPGFTTDPVIVDLDHDTTSEVLIGGGNQLLIWKQDGSKFISNADSIGILRFDSTIAIYPLAVAAECDGNITERPIPVDFNGDGVYEIVVPTANRQVYAFQSGDQDSDDRLDPIAGFPFLGAELGLPRCQAVNFLDRIGPNGPCQELLVNDSFMSLRVVYSNLDGELPFDSLISPGWNAITDLVACRADGRNIIFLGSQPEESGEICRISAPAGSLDFVQDYRVGSGPIAPHALAAGDINRDGSIELAAAVENHLRLLNADGSLAWSYDCDSTLGSPVLGDINSDGYPEIVVTSKNKIYAFAYNGTIMSNFPVDLAKYNMFVPITAEPILGDIDNDGNPDIVFGYPSGAVYAFNYLGDKVSGFPLPSSFDINHACALGDMNGDGKIDLAMVESSGMVKAWNTNSPAITANIPWGMSGGGISGNGFLSPDYAKPITITDSQLPSNSVYNYPNPAVNSTAIRYYLNQSSNVSIEIYDYMGESVHSATVSGQAHANNEYVWDCQGIASGIYFCRVEADSGTEKTWRIFKIAIVK